MPYAARPFAFLALILLAGQIAGQGVVNAARSGEIALDGHVFKVPEGFTIERIAGPPLVERPITADFDDQGRLYIADSSGTNDKVDKQLQDLPHRILRLVDRDGDGTFDDRTVFADKMMFPEGTLWYDGSLYVAAPPSIWKLTDTDDDGVADRREEWFAGKTLTGCANDLHGPYLGPDGWIYWCKGAFAEQRYEKSGVKPLVTKASHIFRCRPDKTGFEHVMTGGMDNPVDVVFTPGGERIFTTTFLQHPGGGKRDGLIHAVYGGVYGKVWEVIESHPRTGDVLPPLSHLGPAAPCGLTRYSADQFGPEWRDNIFAALFNLHKVTRHVLTPAGGTFSSRDEDFVVSNNIDFHPTDVLADADGSVVIVNTGGWYKLCCPTSQLWKPDILGGVYRVRRIDSQAPADPRGKNIDWKQGTPETIAPLLADGRPAVRERAAQWLAKHGPAAVASIARLLNHEWPAVRESGVWALTRIDSPDARAAVRRAVGDKTSNVRQAALHSISLWRDADAAPVLLSTLESTDAGNLRVAAEALGRIGDKSHSPALIKTAQTLGERAAKSRPVSLPNAHDRFLDHAVIYALLELGDRESLEAALRNANPYVVHTALLALDQMDGHPLKPDQVSPHLASTHQVIRETAAWIVGRHPEWGGALAGVLRRRLLGTVIAEADRGEFQTQLAQFARHGEVQSLLSEVAGDSSTSPASRRLALGAMHDAGLKDTPPAWLAAIALALQANDEETVAAAVATARAITWPKAPPAELLVALERLGQDERRPAPVRLDALVALPNGLSSASEKTWEFLLSELSSDKPLTERMSSAAILARAKLTIPQLLELASQLKTVGPLEADRLLSAFEQSTDEKVGLALVAALLESKALASLRLDAVKQRLAKYAGGVPQVAEKLYAAMNVDADKQRARIESLLGQVSGGDIRRGQAVFHSTKAVCSSCHAMGYLGGRVGPDLTRIGGIRNERDLLEAIVYPSASFVRSYEPVVVVTSQGKSYNGLVKKDSVDELVIAINATDEIRIPREDIEEVRPSTLSVMPSGLDQQLTPQELADLIAFLKSAK